MKKCRWGEGRSGAGREPCEMGQIEVYKERLHEMEVAFRYNLSLLADRDAELDILEEQLRSGIVQLERVSREKENCQEALRLMHEEKIKEAILLKNKLMEREKAFKELERKNEGSLRTLRKALEAVKREQRQEIQRAQRMFIRAVRSKELRLGRKRMEEPDAAVNELPRKRLSEGDAILERKTENENPGSVLGHGELKEKFEPIREPNSFRIWGISGEEKPKTECQLADAATQTSDANHTELTILREQNDVLKRIIKNLKGKKEKGTGECDECQQVKERLEETNRRFQAEILHVKREMDRERTEEEAIIQTLEKSLSSLKEKLVKTLGGEDNVGKLEDRLNQRLKIMDQKLEEVRRQVDSGSCAVSIGKIGRRKRA